MLKIASLVGMEEKKAIAKIEKAKMRPRISGRDGEPFMLTMDYRTDRVNLWIENGKVTKSDIG